MTKPVVAGAVWGWLEGLASLQSNAGLVKRGLSLPLAAAVGLDRPVKAPSALTPTWSRPNVATQSALDRPRADIDKPGFTQANDCGIGSCGKQGSRAS